MPMLRSATIRLVAERNDHEGAEEAHENDIGRQRKELLIRRRRNDVFLHDVLDAVGEPLKDALRPNPVGTDARLHARPDAPFEPTGHAGQRRDEDRKHHHCRRAPWRWRKRLLSAHRRRRRLASFGRVRACMIELVNKLNGRSPARRRRGCRSRRSSRRP